MPPLRMADGAMDFSQGVDSSKATTVQGPLNPNGLSRSELAWLMNGTVRDTGISQRFGWNLNGKIISSNPSNPPLFQGKFLVYPTDGSLPFFLIAISGQIYQVNVNTGAALNLSAKFNISNPAGQPYSYFVQGGAQNAYVVIQAGDGVTLPLLVYFSGGTCINILRSRGIVAIGDPNNQIPAATAMVYYQGRIFYAQGALVSGGDIVGGTHGDASVLYVTENPLAVGGDGFALPGQSGNINSLFYNAQLDASLGQGILYIGTNQTIYGLQVPISRANWIAAGSSNGPLLFPVQLTQGTVNDRTVVAVNSDNFYQTLLPSVASLGLQTRYFSQWGNTPISTNEQRILQFVDRSIQRFCSGCYFDNRLLQATLPIQTPSGVVSTAIMPLDFNIISAFNKQLPPAWEGHLEGLQIFQLESGDFGGLERCFATVLNQTNDLELWELTSDERFDENAFGETRVDWYFETPAYTWGKELELKELDGLELWVDKVFGTVDITLEYRPDASPCYVLWNKKQICVTHNCSEDVNNPVCYPTQPNYREGYNFNLCFPKPSGKDCSPMGTRPANIGYQFQFRITIKGWCRIRGIIPYALKYDRAPFDGLDCSNNLIAGSGESPAPPLNPVLSPENSTILPPTATVVDNGISTVEIIVQSKDQFENNFINGGAAVLLTLSGPGTLTQPIDQQNGQYIAIYTAPSGTVGQAVITGTMNGTVIGLTFGGSQSVITVTIPATDAGHSILLPSTIGGIEADGVTTTTVTVTARNSSGVNVGHGGDNVVFSISGLGTVSAAVDNGNGTYTGTVTSPYVTTGTGTVTATLNGQAVGSISGSNQCVVTFTTILPNAANTTVVATSPIVANGAATSTITVTVRDSRGALMSGQATSLTMARQFGGNYNFSPGGGTGSTQTTGGTGVVTWTLTSTASSLNTASSGGLATITATSGGVVITQTASPVFNPQNPSTGASTLAFDPSLPPGGSSTPWPHATPCYFIATLKDLNSNTVPGATVTGAYAGAGATIAYPNGQTSDANGQVVFTVSSLIAQGPFNVSAAWSGSPWTGGGGAAGTIFTTQSLTFN